MRSVFVFLRDTAEAELAAYLDATYPEQRKPWVSFIGGDPCLYINLYKADPREYGPEGWGDIVRQFGGEPAVGVMADVSGRHPGGEQAKTLVAGLLSRFSGAAMDDYTLHLWSLDELQGDHRVEAHPFFDYNGWFVDRKPDAEQTAAPDRGGE